MNPEKFRVMYKFFENLVSDDEEYQCKYCLKPFKTVDELKTHSITEHVIENRYVCDFCNKEYKIQQNMVIHISEEHMKIRVPHFSIRLKGRHNQKKVKPKETEEEYKPDPDSESEDSGSDYDWYDDRGNRCKKPDREYPRQCDHCDYEVPAAKVHYHHYLIEHADILDQYPYRSTEWRVCRYCGVVKNWRIISQHEMQHTGVKVKCTECDKEFRSNKLMYKHKRMVHSTKRYICGYCYREFKTKSDLNRHVRIHTGEKPFKCHICGEGFAHSGNRLIHIRIRHQNEKVSNKTVAVSKNKQDPKSDDEVLNVVQKMKQSNVQKKEKNKVQKTNHNNAI